MDGYAFPKVTELAIPFFVAAILLELWLVRTGRAAGEFETRDTLTSLMMGTGNVVAGILLGFVVYWALVWARQRLGYLFMPPGWSHDGSRETSESLKADYVRRNPAEAGRPGLPGSAAGEGGVVQPAE